MQSLFLKRIPEESGLRLRFPIPGLDSRRFIPPLADEFFLDRHNGWARAGKEKARVGLFVGCVSNYLFPRISKSALDLFLRLGVSVFIPEKQRCCGLPAYGSGDEETPRSLARKNIEAFHEEGLEKIIAPCASCASMLKLEYPLLFDSSDPFRRQVLDFSSRVTDASQFLGGLLASPGGENGQGRRVPAGYVSRSLSSSPQDGHFQGAALSFKSLARSGIRRNVRSQPLLRAGGQF